MLALLLSLFALHGAPFAAALDCNSCQYSCNANDADCNECSDLQKQLADWSSDVDSTCADWWGYGEWVTRIEDAKRMLIDGGDFTESDFWSTRPCRSCMHCFVHACVLGSGVPY